MDNLSTSQPLDILMTRLGVSNADLVNASTEQLTFKMVQRARKGRELKPRIQEKILTAFLAVKPNLKLRRRDLFRYELEEVSVEQVKSALSLIKDRKITYLEFLDLLEKAGINSYAVEVAANRITFHGSGGYAYVEQGQPLTDASSDRYDETALKTAIADAQKGAIDHPIFLKRIYAAGIKLYEVNVRKRRIDYKGEYDSYRENILATVVQPKPVVKTQEPSAPQKVKKTPTTILVRKTGKKIKKHRVKRR